MSYIVAMIPVYNGEDCIRKAVLGLLAQTRVPDRIVVIPNGCSDRTTMAARELTNASVPGGHLVTVFELERMEHKKSEALNRAWHQYAVDADIVPRVADGVVADATVVLSVTTAEAAL